MKNKYFLKGFFDKTLRKEVLFSQLECILRLWIIERILKKDECCINIPDQIGKTIEEMKTLYPKMRYWSIEDYLKLMEGDDKEDLKEEDEERIKYNVDYIREEMIPQFIGGILRKGRLYLMSFDENEITKDVFYIPVDHTMFETFAPIDVIIWKGIIQELKAMGAKMKDIKNDDYISGSILRGGQ